MHTRLCVATLAIALLATAGAYAQPQQHDGHTAPPSTRHRIVVPPDAKTIALPELGIEIIAVHLSAAGQMIDLRYRVLDPVKAKPLMDPAVPITLFEQTSGSDLQVPVDEDFGALRQSGTQVRPGQVLASLFGNAGGVVKKGGKINLRLGDLEVVGLTVEG